MRWIGHTLGAAVLASATTSNALAFSPSGFVAERIESYVSESFGVSIDIGDLDIDLLSRTPGGTATGVSIGDGAGGTIVTGADFSFEIDAGFVTGGDLVFERLALSNAEVDLVVDEDGRGNWQSLLDSLGGGEESASPDDAGGGVPAIRTLDIENVVLGYTDRALGRDVSLELSASGSTTDPNRPLRLEARGEIDGLPALAEVTLVPRGDPVAPSGSLDVDGRLSVGEIRLAVEGSIDDPVAFESLELTLALSAPGGEDIETLAAFELPALGPLALDGSVVRDDGDWRLRTVVASVGDTRVEIDGGLGDPTSARGLAPELSFSLSAPDEADIAPLVEAFTGTDLPALPSFSASGGIVGDDDDWTLDDMQVRLGETRFEVDGTLGDPTTAAGLAPELTFSLSAPDGADVAPLVEAFTGTGLPALPSFSASGGVGSEGGDWTLDDVEARLGETRLEVSGGLGDPMTATGLALELTFSLSAPDGADVAPLVEAFTGTELPALPAFSAAGGVASDGGDWILRDVDARLGDLALTASGALGDPLGPDGLDPRLDFTLDAPDLDDVEALVGSELPPLSPIAFSGSVRRDGDDWVLRRFDGAVGSSTVEGDARVDPSTAPPTVYANLIVPTLDLDELLEAFEGEPADESAAVVEDEPAEEAGRLLPDETLDLRPLTRAVDGALRLRVRDVVATSLPLDSFAGRVEIDGDEIALSSLRIGVAGGTIGGSIDLDAGPAPMAGLVDLRVREIDLKEVARSLDIDDQSFGALGGRAKYWIRGDSIASFAAEADGGLFLLMRGGKLDALLVELASIDLFESALLLLDPGKTLTDIDCGYVSLHTAAGLTEIEHFVLDTADTVFVAAGTADLADESFDVAFEPHPKDASLIEVNTGVRVAGTFADFSVLPGVELGARTVAAAALATIAAPVTALLAFVDAGGAEDSPYCKALVGELGEAR